MIHVYFAKIHGRVADQHKYRLSQEKLPFVGSKKCFTPLGFEKSLVTALGLENHVFALKTLFHPLSGSYDTVRSLQCQNNTVRSPRVFQKALSAAPCALYTLSRAQ